MIQVLYCKQSTTPIDAMIKTMKLGWEIKKLGEVCEILDHLRVPITKKDRREGVYPYYGASGIQDYVDSYIFDGRYLLVGEDGAKWGANDKSAYIIEGKSWVNNHAHILKLNDIISDRLVEYYLVSKDLQEYITGAVVPKLTQQALRNIPIPIPPSEEQERIVAELDCLSGIIEKKREQLKELDALAQSIFYQMFGDPITNEKDWEVKKLGEVCKFSQGVQVDLPLQSTEKKSGWNRFLRIVDYTTCNTDIRYVNISNDKYFVNFDDVVVVRYGASAGFVGIEKEGILANNLFKLNHDRNKLNYKYLYYLLSTDYYKDFVKDIAFGAAMPALSFNSFKNFNIYIPPIALQQEFAEKIEAIEKQKELIKQSITETEDLFNSRMDYYFN